MECRSPLFREIHKNTWLKRVTADNRKIPVGTKKPERYWVVFCVHDDCEAHLEGYLEPRLASTHSPEWTVSLQTTLHISHTLVPAEQEYEFVITLLGDTVRFHASSWEIMQEWIETLRLKLREMKILSPNENLYSKLPEVRPPLLPTRDPMSPLPATPPVPAAIVPGVERVVASTSQNAWQIPLLSSSSPTEPLTENADSNSVQPEAITSSDAPALGSSSIPSTSMSNTLTQNLIKMLSDPVSTYNEQVNNNYATDSEASFDTSTTDEAVDLVSDGEQPAQCPKITSKAERVPSLATTFVNNVLADPNTCGASTSGLSSYVSSPRPIESHNETSSLDSMSSSVCATPEPIVIPRPQTIRKEKSTRQEKNIDGDALMDVIEIGDDGGGGTTTNITIIQVSSPIAKDKFKFDETNGGEDEKYKSNVQIIPSNFTESVHPQIDAEPSTVTTVQVTSAIVVTNETVSQSTVATESISPILSNTHITNVPVGISEVPAVRSAPAPQHYEQVFVMGSAGFTTSNQNDITLPLSPRVNVLQKQQRSASQIEIHVNRIKLQKSIAPSSTVHASAEEPSTSAAAIVSLPLPIASEATNGIKPKIQLEPKRRPLLTRGLTEAVILRSSRKDQPTNRSNIKESTSITSNVQSLRNESSEQRKRSSSTSDTQGVRNRGPTAASNNNAASSANTNNTINNNNSVGPVNDPRPRVQAPPQPFRTPHIELSLHASGRLTMREQQVMQLRREMMHPGGVRLQLRRKDCINSIAFVDAFGAVWISGWKQKEHPMLYNALHIGDQMISIGGVAVHNSNDAHKMIRNSPGLYIEFIIRRVPFGRVYAIRREIDRQCLGLIRDGNTATIVDVVPNSLSARHGLPPKAQACDGLSMTFWVLTEINGRPLNLFFKENEVRDRLNAIGREISILVQPSDLITKLKKQLKSIRGYKEYIVQ